MEQIIWNVYKKFRCIAEKCPDSCCHSWEVDVDEATAACYQALPGELGDRLRQVLLTEDGQSHMVLENGRCPMWRQDGLCRIQAELGHDALCQICREYPRFSLDFGDFREWGLEMSCPEAARLLFSGLTVVSEEQPGGEEPEYDPELMQILRQSQHAVLQFWETDGCTVPEKLAVTLLFAHQTQAALDGEDFTLPDWKVLKAQAAQYTGTGSLALLLEFYQQLEILTPTWQQRLHAPVPGNWDARLQHLAIYLIRRYWLQSVWDFDLICRVKFMVSACILVNALGGDPVETSQLFSKEIENDPDNRETIFDGAYNSPALTDLNLLYLLHP